MARLTDNLDAVMGVHELVDARPGRETIAYYRGPYAECVRLREESIDPDGWDIRPYFDPSSWDAMTEQIISARK